jgi:hypothetical protein
VFDHLPRLTNLLAHLFPLQQQAQSRSGPQTPATKPDAARLASATTYHVRAAKLRDRTSTSNDDDADEDEDQHKRRCVFEKLASGGPHDEPHQHQHHYQSSSARGRHTVATNSLDRSARLAADHQDEGDPRRQYVAVQQGHDIPLKGLRKPAPQPNIYKGKTAATRLARSPTPALCLAPRSFSP